MKPMMRMLSIIVIVVVAAASAALSGWTSAVQQSSGSPTGAPVDASQEPASAPRRAVLVTGASTGLGRATAELLAAKGYFVYAGARKEADLVALNAIANVQAIRLDVTKQADIDAAVKTVRDAGRGLYAVINNAGVGVVGPLIELSEDDLKFQFDVNVYGPYRVTKAFAPMLIESKGRVSTTGSISGTLAWPMGGAYSMSKHAMEAYTDTLATELEPFGVQVSIVDPGNYRSEIFASLRQRMLANGYTTEGSLFKAQMDRMLEVSAGDQSDEKEPTEVAEAFLHAISDEHPKRRYMVVPQREQAEITIKAALVRAVQLNADQPYEFDRETLIKMLDEALAAESK